MLDHGSQGQPDIGPTAETGLPPTPARRQRGTTSVPSSVVARIAEQAASEVPRVGSAAGGLLGVGARRNFNARPSVTCEIYGQVAVLKMDVGLTFPIPLVETVIALREHVRARVKHMTGVDVRSIDIDISWLDPTIPTRGALR